MNIGSRIGLRNIRSVNYLKRSRLWEALRFRLLAFGIRIALRLERKKTTKTPYKLLKRPETLLKRPKNY